MIDQRSAPARKSFREKTIWERLRDPRLWVFAVLGAIGLEIYRHVLDRFWPGAQADLGWLGFQAVVIAGAIAIYTIIGFLVGPFRDR